MLQVHLLKRLQLFKVFYWNTLCLADPDTYIHLHVCFSVDSKTCSHDFDISSLCCFSYFITVALKILHERIIP